MQSIPARMHARIAVSPTACAATRTPARWASSAIAANSASEYCWAPGEVLCDITPPEADTLISLAPCRIW